MGTATFRNGTLVLIALLLALLAVRPLVAVPAPSTQASLASLQPPFTSVQFSGSPRGFLAIDSRTGAVWSYENDGSVCMYVGRITMLGKPLDKAYAPTR